MQLLYALIHSHRRPTSMTRQVWSERWKEFEEAPVLQVCSNLENRHAQRKGRTNRNL